MVYITISPAFSSHWGNGHMIVAQRLVKGKIGILPIVIKNLITGDRGRANWPFIVYGTVIQCLREIRREKVLI